MKSWVLRISHAAAIAGPAAVVIWFVLRYGVNVPFMEQWDFIHYFIKLKSGTLGWSDFFAQHYEHRMVFPKLLMIGVALLTGWNIVVEMLVGVAFTAATLAVLLVLAHPVLIRTTPVARLLAAFAISALLFSLAQWENWLWGWQIQWFLGVFAAVVSVWAATSSLHRPQPWWHVAGAGAAVVVCQFSLASGVLMWAAGALIFAFHPLRRRILLFWAVAAIGSTAFYFVGYSSPTLYPPPSAAADAPLTALLLTGSYLARPIARHAAVGLVAFSIFTALGVLAFARHRRDPHLAVPWIALGLFAVATGALIGIGRTSLGADHGFTSRYATISVLMYVAMVPLGILAAEAVPATDRPWRRVAVGAALLTMLVLVEDVRSAGDLVASEAPRRAGRDCAMAVETATDGCLSLLHPVPRVVRARAVDLKTLGWSAFSATDWKR